MAEENYKDFFEESLNQIRQEYSNSGKEKDFNRWFEKIQYVEDSIDSMTVSVPSEFYWTQLEKNGIITKIQQTLNMLLGQTLEFKFVTTNGIQTKNQETQTLDKKTKSSQAQSKIVEKSPAQKLVEQKSVTPKVTEKIKEEKPQKNEQPLVQKNDTNDSIYIEETESKKNEQLFPGFTRIMEAQKAYEEAHPESVKKIAPKPQIPVKKQHPNLDENYTFENFVPGDNSKYAFEAAFVAAKNPGKTNYNPILIYGGSGLGKTHLMEAIGNYIYAKTPDKKISYVISESLMNEFTTAIREKSMDKFTKKYRSLDVFLLDDIQFLEKSEKLQDEVFCIFNDIYKRKGQLVFTCDRPLSEIKGINERLSSRFGWGLSVDIKIPDYETRKAIIEKKLSVMKRSIPEDAIDYIAQNIKTNVRAIESCLTKCLGYAEIIRKPLTLDIVKEQLQDSIQASSGIITIESIQRAIAEHYQLSISDLKSKNRGRKIVTPRQIAMYICKDITEYSLQDIGDEFGGRDHSTVIHSIEKIENDLKVDANLAATIKLLEQTIKES